MTKKAKVSLTAYLDEVIEDIRTENNESMCGEDHQAYHGLACSLEKLRRKLDAKLPLEDRQKEEKAG